MELQELKKDVMQELSLILGDMTPEERDNLAQEALKLTKDDYFIPHPGPQTEAYFSKADILLYGGEPGGGKTGLLNGLALNCHERSLIVRKDFTDTEGVIDSCKEFVSRKNGNLKGFIGGNRPKFRKPGGGVISFEGIAKSDGGIDTGKQGVARDFIGIDEGAQLPLEAILMLFGWNRTNKEGQRCRMVIASNPPVSSVGDWMASFFAPWLDSDYPSPAEHGELRYYYIDDDSNSVEVGSGEPFYIGEKKIFPHSRTFIPASLSDNPTIDENYQAKLQAIPEPARSILLSGNFLALREDPINQIIPTEWVKAAMSRRVKYPISPESIPMCNIGCDVSGGGKDLVTLAPRYDWWYDDIRSFTSDDLFRNQVDRNKYGRVIAANILTLVSDESFITVDMGGGYGSGVYECLSSTVGMDGNRLRAYKGAEGSTLRTKDGMYGFTNTRTAALWKMREALDPSQPGGSPVCLPDDKMLLSDLTAPTFEITPRGIKAEPKEEVCKKLNRSTDRGDAVIMSNYQGVIGLDPSKDWGRKRVGLLRPKVRVAYSERKRRKV